MFKDGKRAWILEDENGVYDLHWTKELAQGFSTKHTDKIFQVEVRRVKKGKP